MKPIHGLSEETMAQIVEVLARFPQVETAELFGSRAKGTHKAGSDIDLALTGSELDWRMVGRISTAFDDSKLPYHFSLVVLNARTDPDVAAHIKRVGVPIYQHAAVATR